MHNTRRGEKLWAKVEQTDGRGKTGGKADGQWQPTDTRWNIIYNDCSRWPAEKHNFSTAQSPREHPEKWKTIIIIITRIFPIQVL